MLLVIDEKENCCKVNMMRWWTKLKLVISSQEEERTRKLITTLQKLHLSRNGQSLEGEEEDFIDCIYTIEWDLRHVCFQQGWIDFAFVAHIGGDSTLLIKMYTMHEYIGLNFVEIIN
jgi:hypothetical protein